MSTQILQHSPNIIAALQKKIPIKKEKVKRISKPKKLSDKEIDKILKKVAGGLELDKHLNPEELNRLYDEQYE